MGGRKIEASGCMVAPRFRCYAVKCVTKCNSEMRRIQRFSAATPDNLAASPTSGQTREVLEFWIKSLATRPAMITLFHDYVSLNPNPLYCASLSVITSKWMEFQTRVIICSTTKIIYRLIHLKKTCNPHNTINSAVSVSTLVSLP